MTAAACRSPDPEAQDCREVAGVLQGVVARLETIESRLPPVAPHDHGGLPALCTTPTTVVYDSPTLTEALRVHENARAAVMLEISTAQRLSFEQWGNRGLVLLVALVAIGGVMMLYRLGLWIWA